MVEIQPLLAALTAALGLSFMVERVLEFVNGLLDRFFFRGKAAYSKARLTAEQEINKLAERAQEDFKTKRAEELAEIRARLRREGGALSSEQKSALEKRAQELSGFEPNMSKLEQREKFSEATIFVEPATKRPYEATLRTFWMQIFGALLGIGLCLYYKIEIFAKLFQERLPVPERFDQIFTGVLIGAGSQPVHFLINFITQRKIQTLKEEVSSKPSPVVKTPMAPSEKEEKTPAVTPAPVASPSQPAIPVTPVSEINVPYTGGVDREDLEHRHLRPGKPNLIVFHHTALHSETTFADLVKFIKDKGWSTGYHCVALKDGSIDDFCRWDRFGNHAKGHNLRSLGIAMNGNFETDPADSFANVNGRFGEPKPTDEQLHAAARVVVLWCNLYDIPVAWEKSIVPHRAITQTKCPGNNFPYAELKSLIEHYQQRWANSTTAREELELYKQKPYLFDKKWGAV